MKTEKIGNIEVLVCEDIGDLSIKRFNSFKEYMVMKQTGVSMPDLIHTFRGFVQGFDNDSKSQMLITLYNYLQGLEAVENKIDYDQLLFAVITFEKDEEKTTFNENLAKEKLERYSKQGLTQGMVEECVVNFINASPNSLIFSLSQSLETLKTTEE